jgi:predicted GNAT family N-acyltransferase
MLSVEVSDWPTARAEATRIRFAVFVLEQKVPPELEMDDVDLDCDHALAYDGDRRAIATGRLLPDGHIGRMAVLADRRGLGIGAAVLARLVARARERGFPEVVLNAQTHAIGFYAKHGFTPYGAQFMEAGIPHVAMRLALDSV